MSSPSRRGRKVKACLVNMIKIHALVCSEEPNNVGGVSSMSSPAGTVSKVHARVVPSHVRSLAEVLLFLASS
jgi:hypothetical protein